VKWNGAADRAHNKFRFTNLAALGGASDLGAVVMHLKKMIAPAWKFGKELLLFCSVGGLCGAAVGFFLYLHLGPFKNPEDAGYAAGLFVKSGVQLGFVVWMIHLIVRGLRYWIFASLKASIPKLARSGGPLAKTGVESCNPPLSQECHSNRGKSQWIFHKKRKEKEEMTRPASS
jgi:hypothetical protein